MYMRDEGTIAYGPCHTLSLFNGQNYYVIMMKDKKVVSYKIPGNVEIEYMAENIRTSFKGTVDGKHDRFYISGNMLKGADTEYSSEIEVSIHEDAESLFETLAEIIAD